MIWVVAARSLPFSGRTWFGDNYEAAAKRLVASILRISGRGSQPDLLVGSAGGHRVAVEVSIAQPDASDAGLRLPVRSVVYVTSGRGPSGT